MCPLGHAPQPLYTAIVDPRPLQKILDPRLHPLDPPPPVSRQCPPPPCGEIVAEIVPPPVVACTSAARGENQSN